MRRSLAALTVELNKLKITEAQLATRMGATIVRRMPRLDSWRDSRKPPGLVMSLLTRMERLAIAASRPPARS